jgi:hypothetical protein
VPRPFRQEGLGAADAAVLHWPGEQLWVWTGNAAPPERKARAWALAAQLQAAGEAAGAEHAPQHGEPPLFRMHFQHWQVGAPPARPWPGGGPAGPEAGLLRARSVPRRA